MNFSSTEELSPSDPLLIRARELLLKELPKAPTLWVKPPGDTELWCSESRVLHPWFPEYRRLLANGWQELSDDDAQKWDQIAIFGGRHKEENRQLVESCRGKLSENGRLYFVLPNDYGAKSFQKEIAKTGALLEDFVGRKSRLFLLPQGEPSDFFPLQLNEENLFSTPGLFSWKKRDRGSEILGEVLKDEGWDGPVADLGAGWGYLSRQLPSPTEIHLLEADRRGVVACQKNLEQHTNAKVYWSDVTQPQDLPESLVGRVRTVIMNPPFHTNKKAEPVLGGAFVASARRLLGKRGQLFLVGNSHLPYKKIMAAFFSQVEELRRQDGYTVYRGSVS